MESKRIGKSEFRNREREVLLLLYTAFSYCFAKSIVLQLSGWMCCAYRHRQGPANGRNPWDSDTWSFPLPRPNSSSSSSSFSSSTSQFAGCCCCRLQTTHAHEGTQRHCNADCIQPSKAHFSSSKSNATMATTKLHLYFFPLDIEKRKKKNERFFS